jgi:hypothetical protein
MPGAPLTSTEGLEIGDVLQVAVRLIGKHDGQPYWWKTFRCVLELTFPGYARLLILKMHPDPDKDIRDELINLTPDRVFVKLEEHELPQGVLAMRMKHTSLGLIVPF